MKYDYIIDDLRSFIDELFLAESERDDLDYDNQLLRERIDELEAKIVRLEEEVDNLHRGNDYQDRYNGDYI